MPTSWPLLLAVVASLLLATPATAGTPDQPDLEDPAEDVTVHNSPVPAPWAGAIDVLAAWIEEEPEGLRATLRLRDLPSVTRTEAGVLQDTMFFVTWQPSYQNATGAAARTGEWMLRAEYRPQDRSPWHFWMERPCLDGSDDDGCSGPQRDILDGLDGGHDMANGTVTMVAPWRHLADPQPGDGIWSLSAGAQMAWPSYPAYALDWDRDQRDVCHLFQTLPLTPERLAGEDDGPTGTSHGMVTPPEPRATEDPCPAARAALGPTEGAQEDGPGGGGSNGTPVGSAATFVVALGAIVWSRRRLHA